MFKAQPVNQIGISANINFIVHLKKSLAARCCGQSECWINKYTCPLCSPQYINLSKCVHYMADQVIELHWIPSRISQKNVL